MAEQSEYPLVELRNVTKHFPVARGFMESLSGQPPKVVHAVEDVSFQIQRGEVFGLAGESGSGKTTTGRLAIHLLKPTSGEVIFNGINLETLSESDMRRMRRQMQAIFQDPFASMNPRMTLGEGIGHGLKIQKLENSAAAIEQRVKEILDHVGLTPAEAYYNRYPHQISGGQRQRAVIARALVLHPDFIMADEPIAMADVSVRSVLLDLMIRLKQEFNLTYLFITHDLATAKYICDRIAIMYLGKIVEIGTIHDVYQNPQHPYTEALLAAVPVPDPRHKRAKPIPAGEIPNPINPPSGCRFHPRCPIAQEVCKHEVPQLRLAPTGGDNLAACHLRTGDYQQLDPTVPTAFHI
ncbi:MAG: ABC transporter ATP-binding protein [Chloroflexota bacterium]